MPNSTIEHPLQQYHFRALSCMAAAATLYTSTSQSKYDWLIYTYALIMLIFPYIALRLSKLTVLKKKPYLRNHLSSIDAALIGGMLTLIDFSLLPTILFFALVQFNALISGGMVQWRNDNLMLIAGIAILSLFHEPVFNFDANLEISRAALIGISSYFCIYGFKIYLSQKTLTKQVTDALDDRKALLDVNYKLSKYISPQVHSAVMAGKDVALGTQRKKLTIFFSDIIDFSTLAEELDAEPLTDLLNTYLTEMSTIAQRYEGTIDKFIGDAIMVFFGDPTSDGAKMDAMKAVGMAIAMRKHLRKLQKTWSIQGVEKPLEMRMGINTGYATVGNFGTESRMDYTALGTEVNLASRLESAAKPGQILISHTTYALIKDRIMCRRCGAIQVKGFDRPIDVYEAIDWRKNVGSQQSFFEKHTAGFSLHVDIDELAEKDRSAAIEALKLATHRIESKIRTTKS